MSFFTGKPIGAGGNNRTMVADPAIEVPLAAAEASVGAERCQHWSEVQKAFLQRFALLPLASPTIYWFSHGIEFSPGAAFSNVRFIRRAS
jgi:hypothetical protein